MAIHNRIPLLMTLFRHTFYFGTSTLEKDEWRTGTCKEGISLGPGDSDAGPCLKLTRFVPHAR